MGIEVAGEINRKAQERVQREVELPLLTRPQALTGHHQHGAADNCRRVIDLAHGQVFVSPQDIHGQQLSSVKWSLRSKWKVVNRPGSFWLRRAIADVLHLKEETIQMDGQSLWV